MALTAVVGRPQGPIERARAQTGDDALATAARSITETDLRRSVAWIAHDSTRGRATPSHGLERVAARIAARFRAAGLIPTGDGGSYLQRFPIEENLIDLSSARVTFGEDPELRLGRGVQLLFNHGSPVRVAAEAIALAGPLEDPSELEGLGLEDRAVLLVHPAGPEGGFAPGLGDLLNPVMTGPDPPAIIVVSDRGESAFGAASSSLRVPALEPGWAMDKRFNHGVFEVRASGVESALAREGFDVRRALEYPPERLSVTPLPELTVRVELPRRRLRRLSGPNVVGIRPGTGELADEYVVVMAHMDGRGVGSPDAEGDSIYNGADDNASGTAALLELAESFEGLGGRDARSVLFVATGGEELGPHGLWGSDFLAKNPPVPLERIAAVLNLDMIGRAWWPDTVPVIDMRETGLRDPIVRAARRSGAGLTPVSRGPEGLSYGQADQAPFLREGIPAVIVSTSGPQPDYHTPADEAALIDFAWLERVTRFTLHAVAQLAVARDLGSGRERESEPDAGEAETRRAGRPAGAQASAYSTEEVRFRSGDLTLAGLWSVPEGSGPFPAVVVIRGSGPSRRGNPWTEMFVDLLASNGIAVLLPDKRGSGASEGDWRKADFENLADDALAGVRFARGRREIRDDAVGLMGLSQGGRIAPVAAARSDHVAFVVDVVGSAVPFDQGLAYEMRHTFREAGLEGRRLEEAMELFHVAERYLRDEISWAEYRRRLEAARAGDWADVTRDYFIDDPEHWRWDFFRGVLDFDPIPHWTRVAQPLLVLYGAEDRNADVSTSVERLRDAFDESGHDDVTIRVFEGVGHALMDPASRHPDHQLLPELRELLVRWIHERTGGD